MCRGEVADRDRQPSLDCEWNYTLNPTTTHLINHSRALMGSAKRAVRLAQAISFRICRPSCEFVM